MYKIDYNQNKENCFLVVTRHLLPVSLYQRAIQR